MLAGFITILRTFRRRKATVLWTMGTMRDNFTAAFVLFAVMLSTSQSLLHGEENASGRNSLTPTTSHPTTYNCLFVDENMPICDPKRMLDSNEDSWSSTATDDETTDLNENRDKGAAISSESPVFATIKRITVYTFAGCVPPIPREGLRSLMPFCEGIPLNKIVSVQRFRLFAVKGVEQSPLEFPKVNHSQWRTMMMRLRNHPRKDPTVVPNSSQPPQDPPKKAAPNATATDANTSVGSPPSSFILIKPTKLMEPTNKGQISDAVAPTTPSLGKASRTSIAKDQRFYKKSLVNVPSNDLTNDGDSNGRPFSRTESILSSSDAITTRLRRKRDLIH
ncbi:uncharacterized protein LOC143373580 [Andrena cerasifolii]|uniref:uncharacterized protein LOC143373580 n=1 Tax=Andrena cerasifolii TaxID=2819439 RepID=UPI004037C152